MRFGNDKEFAKYDNDNNGTVSTEEFSQGEKQKAHRAKQEGVIISQAWKLLVGNKAMLASSGTAPQHPLC